MLETSFLISFFYKQKTRWNSDIENLICTTVNALIRLVWDKALIDSYKEVHLARYSFRFNYGQYKYLI